MIHTVKTSHTLVASLAEYGERKPPHDRCFQVARPRLSSRLPREWSDATLPVRQRNTEDRLENPRLVTPLPMSRVQDISSIFVPRSARSPLGSFIAHRFVRLRSELSRHISQPSRIKRPHPITKPVSLSIEQTVFSSGQPQSDNAAGCEFHNARPSLRESLA